MNIDYAKRLQTYFADHVSDNMFDQKIGVFDTSHPDEPPACGCFGVHSAHFNQSYIHHGDGCRWTFRLGETANERQGITTQILIEAMVSLAGVTVAEDLLDYIDWMEYDIDGEPYEDNEPPAITDPYESWDWPFSPDEVIGEVIRIYEEKNSEVKSNV